jgi:hypothetical protein
MGIENSSEKPVVQAAEGRDSAAESAGMPDEAYHALQEEVAALDKQVREVKEDLERSNDAVELQAIRAEIAKGLAYISSHKDQYPQFADDIASLERFRGMGPNMTADSSAVSAAMNSSLQSEFAKMYINGSRKSLATQYEEAVQARVMEEGRANENNRALYGEWESKKALLENETRRRAAASGSLPT